ncbi:MAG TPA: dihydroxyacetone kinase [Clostridiales bacterium]|nr:dihydroxyacetone kinase [Clostridiales bacterium]
MKKNMKTIDGQMLKNMIITGTNILQKNKNAINDLNVFPVPDGDTGTNMTLTISSVANEVKKLSNTATIAEVAKVASNGALRGARGNSGVILSQIFRGFASGLTDKIEATPHDLAFAFSEASVAAYKAVMKPKEGTILTIIREFGEKATEIADNHDNVKEFLKEAYNYAEEVLLKTPEMLEELKQAEVVDAGGKGFLHIIEGFIDGMVDLEPELYTDSDISISSDSIKKIDTSNILFEYCTEVMIKRGPKQNANMKTLNMFLNKSGDSIVLVEDDEVIKVHIHTNNPGKVLEEALKMGRLVHIKIENMKEQHEDIISKQEENKKNEPAKEIGFVSVASGSGLENIMKDLGADYVVNGGQSMNPSTDDLLLAVNNVNANSIIILPNNKNIILSAKQVIDVVKDKNIYVIDTTNIPQGISTLLAYNPSELIEKNLDNLQKSYKNLKSAEITYAVRNTVVDDKKINTNDILGIIQGKIEKVGKKVFETVIDTIDAMIDQDSELISIYYGEGINENDAKKVKEYILKKYPDCDVELQFGGQPVYYYIISVE